MGSAVTTGLALPVGRGQPKISQGRCLAHRLLPAWEVLGRCELLPTPQCPHLQWGFSQLVELEHVCVTHLRLVVLQPCSSSGIRGMDAPLSSELLNSLLLSSCLVAAGIQCCRSSLLGLPCPPADISSSPAWQGGCVLCWGSHWSWGQHIVCGG